MSGEQGTLNVREHGGVEPDDAREAVATGPHQCEQVLPDFLFDGVMLMSGGAQFPECRGCGWLRPGLRRGGSRGLDR
jgi:hypothetical protein